MSEKVNCAKWAKSVLVSSSSSFPSDWTKNHFVAVITFLPTVRQKQGHEAIMRLTLFNFLSLFRRQKISSRGFFRDHHWKFARYSVANRTFKKSPLFKKNVMVFFQAWDIFLCYQNWKKPGFLCVRTCSYVVKFPFRAFVRFFETIWKFALFVEREKRRWEREVYRHHGDIPQVAELSAY